MLVPMRAMVTSESAHACRIGSCAVQALKAAPAKTEARGGATPASTRRDSTSGLVAHCRYSHAASCCLDQLETEMPQPMTTGLLMPVARPGGNGFTPRSVARLGKRMMLANSLLLS